MHDQGKRFLLVFLLAFFSVLTIHKLYETGQTNTWKKTEIQNESFRAEFFSDKLWKRKDQLPQESSRLLEAVKQEVKYFPVPESTLDPKLKTSYVNTWMSERNYGGKRGHEGIDIMALKNQRGLYPVLSMTDGVITNLGWLEQGGYRIGITGNSGTYYYYAHLDSYTEIQKGDKVKAGELLGYMGDSGYGPEGTTGKFDVHLHIGIYVYLDGEEISLNPYYVLRWLEERRLKYEFSG